MAYKNQPWFSDLALNEEIFASLPQGENPLIWAIQNKHISDEKYAHWASEFYQLPRLHDHFFSMAMDYSLTQKYAGLYTWNSLCYPVYEWEEVLYVACIEPPQIADAENICFVVATMEAMHRGWAQNSEHKKGLTQPQAPAIPLDAVDFSSEQPSQPAVAEADFAEENFEEDEFSKSEASSIESTVIDFQVPATKSPKKEDTVASAPPPPVPDLDFSDLGLDKPNKSFNEFESIKTIEKKKEAFINAKETKKESEDSFLKEISFDGLNEDGKTPPSNAPLSSQEDDGEFDDDITPPPTSTNIKIAPDLDSSTQVDLPEVTETDKSSPVFIPKDKKITAEDLKKFSNLENCKGTKDIMSHIFCHLTKDFQKLMWVELSESGQFFPRFVYGPWKMDSASWNYPVDVSKPNIFKIAFVSSLPFHGPVSVNKVNNNYFQWWNHGENPGHVTAYPVVYEEACYGFITCFGKEKEFDEVDSLKKIENLLAICEKAFHKIHMKKAG